jgi:uncharacterized membrane protein YkoI
MADIDDRRFTMTPGKTLTAIIVCAAIAGSSMATAFSARAFTGEELSAQAKISLSEARDIALKAVPGSIASEELEREDGSLRYTFDIKNGVVVHEVGVDAGTGKILENIVEDPSGR